MCVVGRFLTGQKPKAWPRTVSCALKYDEMNPKPGPYKEAFLRVKLWRVLLVGGHVAIHPISATFMQIMTLCCMRSQSRHVTLSTITLLAVMHVVRGQRQKFWMQRSFSLTLHSKTARRLNQTHGNIDSFYKKYCFLFGHCMNWRQ